MAKDLWTDKYRPVTLDDYVWRDPELREVAEAWLHDQAIPHVIFAGPPGTGKTSLARLLLHLLEIPGTDLLLLNASRERRADGITGAVENFIGQWPLGPTGIKYVLLDEADTMSPLAQNVLREWMQTYSTTCRFLLTGNQPSKILPALHSRCEYFAFHALNIDEFTIRLGQVLIGEAIEFSLPILHDVVTLAYPDLRKAINLLQQHCRSGILRPPETVADTVAKDYQLDMVRLFRERQFLAGRRLILAQARIEEYPQIYRLLYENLHWFGDSEVIQNAALLVIRDGLMAHALVCDPEINLAATLVALTQLAPVTTSADIAPR